MTAAAQQISLLANLPAPIWMPQCAKLALADPYQSYEQFDASWARKKLVEGGIDMPALLTELRRGLQPVPQGWLARRLEALWNSHSHAGSMKASDWLRETGRLLADLPFDIVAEAIDTAVNCLLYTSDAA